MLARGGVATLQLYLEILFFCIKIVTATSAWGLFNKVYFLFGNLQGPQSQRTLFNLQIMNGKHYATLKIEVFY